MYDGVVSYIFGGGKLTYMQLDIGVVFCRKMVWKDFAGIFPGQQLSGQLGRKEVRQSLCVLCSCVCTVPPVHPRTAAVVGDRRRRQRVREARPENFLCFFFFENLKSPTS